MTAILYLVLLFLVSFYFLYLLRRSFAREFQALSLLLFKTTQPGFYLYLLFSFPGTIVHELSHWLMAEILQVRTGQIRLLPNSFDTQKVHRLGSVETANTDLIRGFLIGLAPFFTGLTLLFWLTHLFFQSPNLIYVYSIWTLSQGMLVSRSDLRSWPLIVVIVFFTYLFFIHFHFQLLPWFISNLTLLVKALYVAVGLGFSFLFLLYLIRFILEKLLHRRIVFK